MPSNRTGENDLFGSVLQGAVTRAPQPARFLITVVAVSATQPAGSPFTTAVSAPPCGAPHAGWLRGGQPGFSGSVAGSLPGFPCGTYLQSFPFAVLLARGFLLQSALLYCFRVGRIYGVSQRPRAKVYAIQELADSPRTHAIFFGAFDRVQSKPIVVRDHAVEHIGTACELKLPVNV